MQRLSFVQRKPEPAGLRPTNVARCPNGRLYSELNRVASELAPRIVQDLPQYEWWGWASVYDQANV
jgi:hypothetical protein